MHGDVFKDRSRDSAIFKMENFKIPSGSFHVKSPKKFVFNPVFPSWLIFGTSVAWHVCIKLAKSFEPIKNGFGDMPYCIEFSLFRGFHNIGQLLVMPKATCFYVCNYLHWIPVGMKICISRVLRWRIFEMEIFQKVKVKTLKKIGFWLKCGSYLSKKKQKVFKLVRGCQTSTEKVQVQLWQSFAVTRCILLQS